MHVKRERIQFSKGKVRKCMWSGKDTIQREKGKQCCGTVTIFYDTGSGSGSYF
jgi:hypothetical protein